jgi:hypothetical protein
MTTSKHDEKSAAKAKEKEGSDGGRALGRRKFLGATGSLAVASAALGSLTTGLRTKADAQWRPDVGPGWGGSGGRRLRSDTLRLRIERAHANYNLPFLPQPNNGDTARYANKIGSDTRGLPHDARGEVDRNAFDLYTRALESQDPADFEKIPLGGTRKLANPLGGVALSLTGAAQSQVRIVPAPALASAERAADAVELYWHALLRDVPFSEYRNDTRNELVLAASAELTSLPDFSGPRDASGRVTPELLFRGSARYTDPSDPLGLRPRTVALPGTLVGPYISQFLLRDIPYGTLFIGATSRLPSAIKENDFFTTYQEWLGNQNGGTAPRSLRYDAQRRYISTGRDLAAYAGSGSPSLTGAELLLAAAVSSDPSVAGGYAAPTTPQNPYLKLKTSSGNTSTWGQPYVQSLLYLARSREQRVAYWNKNNVHRTLRPEAFGGLVHNVLANGVDYPLHDDVLGSEAVERIFQKFGTYLLPTSLPDGAPLHGSYPGGGASTAGAHATLLKAFYDESWVLPNPVQTDPSDPTRLIPYVGPPLTLGGELNKLAANISIGRNWGAIHWRSDAGAGLVGAEQFVISLLADERGTFREPFEGFRFTRFDGSVVTV